MDATTAVAIYAAIVATVAVEEDARKQVTAMTDSINRPHTIERVEPVAAD